MADSLDARPTRRALRIAGAVAAVGVLGALAFAPRFANGAARVLLPLAEIPPYTATRIDNASVKPGDTRIPEGSTVRIEARVTGVIPAEAKLLFRGKATATFAPRGWPRTRPRAPCSASRCPR
jgi:hypothetical protein